MEMLKVHIIFLSFLLSSAVYFYLHKKTNMNLKYLFIDNVIVASISIIISFIFSKWLMFSTNKWLNLTIISFFILASVIVLGFFITMLRFWRTPNRKITAKNNEIVCPADGKIIYIKYINAGDTPVSIKN